MSFAPASSLGAFLKARLAVNGIQCAARSFGTLTAGALGLLSSMGASCKAFGDGKLDGNYQLRRVTGTPHNLRSLDPYRRFVALFQPRSAAAIQNTSASESSLSSQSSGACG